MAAKVRPIRQDQPEGDSLSLPDILNLEGEVKPPKSDEIAKKKVGGYDDTVRWPLWKTVVVVIALCGAFWTAVIMFLIRAFS